MMNSIWIDTPIKWYNLLNYKSLKPRAISPQRQYSELLLLPTTISFTTGCCGTLPCHKSTISKLRLRYRDTHDVNDRPRSGRPRTKTVSPQIYWIVQFAWRLWGIVASLHAVYRYAITGRHGRLESVTCFPVLESCTEASPNNWVNWWPVLPVSCGWAEIFWHFLLDPTSLLWTDGTV